MTFDDLKMNNVLSKSHLSLLYLGISFASFTGLVFLDGQIMQWNAIWLSLGFFFSKNFCGLAFRRLVKRILLHYSIHMPSRGIFSLCQQKGMTWTKQRGHSQLTEGRWEITGRSEGGKFGVKLHPLCPPEKVFLKPVEGISPGYGTRSSAMSQAREICSPTGFEWVFVCVLIMEDLNLWHLSKLTSSFRN